MECMNDRASLELLRHANASLRRFFQRFAGVAVSGGDEELRALLELHEVLESVGALLDGPLQATTNREVREALDCYHQNLVRLRNELTIMEGAAIACRVGLDSQRQHLYGARAWCAAARAIG
jgi:hypothetical protein